MDPKSKEYLDEILAKDPETLNPDEQAFLRARRSYLKKSQLAEYDGIINPVVEEEAPAPIYVAKKDQKDQTSASAEPVKENAKESQ